MMEVKKFEAPTLAEALQVIKRELGPDAVILSTKNNRSGFGLLAKGSVEVTAAVNAELLEKKKLAEAKLTPAQLAALYRKPSQKVNKAYDVLSGSRVDKMMDAIDASVSSHRALASSENSAYSNQKVAAQRSMQAPKLTQRRYIDISDDESPAEMASAYSHDSARISHPQPSLMEQARMQSANKALAQQQAARSAALAQQQAAAFAQQQTAASTGPYGAAAAQQASNASAAFASTYTPTQSNSRANGQILPSLLAQLIDMGVEQDIVRELGDELKLIMVKEQVNREDVARAHLGRLVMSRLRVAKPLSERLRIPTTPRMIAFVGPTGVGKTTTIAKIAAELVINQHQAVVLATTDTFKIAAIDQLQTYANILKIPLEVCPNAESLAELQASLGPDQVVLIDTAGFGPRDESKIYELKDILSSVRTETHLCVGAMTRDRDLTDTIKRFKIFEPNYLVMTKLDETSSFGGILNVGVRSHLPLSYFTMGQRVPEDMEVATKERVADLLLNISGGV